MLVLFHSSETIFQRIYTPPKINRAHFVGQSKKVSKEKKKSQHRKPKQNEILKYTRTSHTVHTHTQMRHDEKWQEEKRKTKMNAFAYKQQWFGRERSCCS